MKTSEERARNQERRLIRLARLSLSYEAFFDRARRFTGFYGFPGMGSAADYQRIYAQIKTGKPC